MPIPTEHWPKPWVLERHRLAVEHGMIWVTPISEADALSLRKRAYRMRRRSDTSMAAFIPPEYHLVMIGRWEKGPDGRGRLPFIYNALPDGVALPDTIVASGEEVSSYSKAPAIVGDPPPIDLGSLDLKIEETDVDGLVAKLRKSARERGND